MRERLASVVPPQLTARALLLGLVLSAILAGANAYLGMFAGITVAASIPAAVVSMAVLKFFRNSNILENNMVQTTASAGESLAAGVIFTMPALVMLNYWDAFDYVWVTVIAGLGGLLGVLFTIPLRRSLIIEEKLAFPEGTATAEVLLAGSSGRGLTLLTVAAIVGGFMKLAETGFRLWNGTAQAAAYFGTSTIAYAGTNLSAALLGVGYIVGLNIAFLVFFGGVISWHVAIPIYATWFLDNNAALAAELAAGTGAADLAYAIWSAEVRYLGVGAMLVGGVWALISMRAALWSGIRSGFERRPATEIGHYDHTDHDAPMRIVLAGIVIFVLPLAGLYYVIVGTVGIAAALSIVMVLTGFVFSSVAGYMAGLVGSSNNPVSGIAIATILLTSLLMWMLGAEDTTGAAAAIMVGAVVCCAAAIGGDTLQDLKAGHLLRATPWRQQLGQALGVIAAVLVMAPVLNLLLDAYGIGAPTPAHPDPLLAPQAALMASVAQGVFGADLPWPMIGLGAAVGIAIIAADEYLRRSRATWRMPVLAVAVGIYLPLELAVPIFAGGIIAHAAARVRLRRAGGADEDGQRNGVLFAAGLIAGEALIGIAMAVPIVLYEDRDVLALAIDLPDWVGLFVIAAIAAALFRVATRR